MDIHEMKKKKKEERNGNLIWMKENGRKGGTEWAAVGGGGLFVSCHFLEDKGEEVVVGLLLEVLCLTPEFPQRKFRKKEEKKNFPNKIPDSLAGREREREREACFIQKLLLSSINLERGKIWVGGMGLPHQKSPTLEPPFLPMPNPTYLEVTTVSPSSPHIPPLAIFFKSEFVCVCVWRRREGGHPQGEKKGTFSYKKKIFFAWKDHLKKKDHFFLSLVAKLSTVPVGVGSGTTTLLLIFLGEQQDCQALHS